MEIEQMNDIEQLFELFLRGGDNAVKVKDRVKQLSGEGKKDEMISYLRTFTTTDKSFEAYTLIAEITGLQFMEAVIKYPAKKKQ